MTIPTLNVIECTAGVIISLRAFPDSVDGSRDAKHCFMECASENGCPSEDLEGAVAAGEWSDPQGYEVLLVNSYQP